MGIFGINSIIATLKSSLHMLSCFLRILFVIINNFYCIPTYLIWNWIFFLPLRIIRLPLYYYIESVMFEWILYMVAAWSYYSGCSIYEGGDDVSKYYDESCLVLVNHQSTADVPMLMQAFQEKSHIHRKIMWVLDKLFRFTNFGAVCITHDDFFIAQGKNTRESQLILLENHLVKSYLKKGRQWIIVFPEGGFLFKRKELSQKYAKQHNYPFLERLTLPRAGALFTILKTLRPDILNKVESQNPTEDIKKAKIEIETHAKENLPETKLNDAKSNPEKEHKDDPKTQNEEEQTKLLKQVIDITICYPDQSDPLEILAITGKSRPPSKTYFHYRSFPIKDIPSSDDEELKLWLYDRWVEKEVIMNDFYTNGLPSNARKVNLSFWWVFSLHCGFIASSLFHCWLGIRIFSAIF